MAVVFLVAGPGTARAQQRNSDPNTLGGLIDGLRILQERGGFPGMSNQGQLLDQSRGQGTQGRDGRGAVDLAPPAELSPQEKALAQRFCTDNLRPGERELVPLVTQFSNVEKDYCLRLRSLIFQFGYDLFRGNYSGNEPFNGAISDNYRLGIGDELVITLIGQETLSQRIRVDREGRVTLSRLGPIPAVGLTMQQFQRELSARTNSAFIGTEAYASLGTLRQFSVVVVGEVNRPGIQQVTGLSSILDALAMAGGVKKTGSLRQVRIIRGDRPVAIDLYNLLMGTASGPDIGLREGDRIVVPTLGPTIGIAGDTQRPAVYELPPATASIPAVEALALSGGTIRPAGAKYIRITFDPEGRELVSEISSTDFRVAPGDLILIGKGEDVQIGSVVVAGDVRVPGRRSLRSAGTIGAILRDNNAFRERSYLPFGVLVTNDPQTLARRYYAVNLRSILDGAEDYLLRDGDELIVLSDADVRFLSSRTVQTIISDRRDRSILSQDTESLQSTRNRNRDDSSATAQQQIPILETATLGRLEGVVIDPALRGDVLPTTGPLQATTQAGRLQTQGAAGVLATGPLAPQRPRECRSALALRKLVFETRDSRFSNAIVPSDEPPLLTPGALVPLSDECPEIFEKSLDLLPFLLEHSINVTGEVRRPGVYPVVPNTGLDAIAAIAGGLTREADLQRVEVSRFAAASANVGPTIRQTVDLKAQTASAVSVGPGDVVRFNPLFSDRDSGPVFLSGEVVRPGSYEIRRGERLSEIIARAGGLTAQAYPYGAVFTRERVKRAEQVALQRLARELNTAVTLAAARRSVDSGALQNFSQLSRDVANAPATGRVVIEADPTVLQVRPELDVVLEPGDRLYVPKRPNSVLVTGDVLNPGAQQFVSGRRADAYVKLAGGLQRSADSDRVFIVLPNGAAQPVGVSAFNFTPVQVPPGSTIVVPKDAAPFDLFTFARDISSVLGQLAVTAAALTVISNN